MMRPRVTRVAALAATLCALAATLTVVCVAATDASPARAAAAKPSADGLAAAALRAAPAHRDTAAHPAADRGQRLQRQGRTAVASPVTSKHNPDHVRPTMASKEKALHATGMRSAPSPPDSEPRASPAHPPPSARPGTRKPDKRHGGGRGAQAIDEYCAPGCPMHWLADGTYATSAC